MTPKPSATGRPTAKSKGFAFLEFTNKQPLQTALKLHQSDLQGRMINVELTAGGGGKSDGRLKKVKERNKELFEQRVSLLVMSEWLRRLTRLYYRKRSLSNRRAKMTLRAMSKTSRALRGTPPRQVSLKPLLPRERGQYQKAETISLRRRREALRSRQNHKALVSTLYQLVELTESG